MTISRRIQVCLHVSCILASVIFPIAPAIIVSKSHLSFIHVTWNEEEGKEAKTRWGLTALETDKPKKQSSIFWLTTQPTNQPSHQTQPKPDGFGTVPVFFFLFGASVADRSLRECAFALLCLRCSVIQQT